MWGGCFLYNFLGYASELVCLFLCVRCVRQRLSWTSLSFLDQIRTLDICLASKCEISHIGSLLVVWIADVAEEGEEHGHVITLEVLVGVITRWIVTSWGEWIWRVTGVV